MHGTGLCESELERNGATFIIELLMQDVIIEVVNTYGLFWLTAYRHLLFSYLHELERLNRLQRKLLTACKLLKSVWGRFCVSGCGYHGILRPAEVAAHLLPGVQQVEFGLLVRFMLLFCSVSLCRTQAR